MTESPYDRPYGAPGAPGSPGSPGSSGDQRQGQGPQQSGQYGQLNFQLTLIIAYVVCAVLVIVMIGFLLMPLLWIGSLIMTIVGAVAANRGSNFRYALNIRFVS
ncbi:DUF4870 domain-containing protein [Sphaerisporangium sp. NPDC051017]|uniref:DUF4870 domain-containing protein n=1 Tax=Sphaerisporangium sp. NPDC051017 TaxID=3154636 RepID=UPI00341EE09E